MLANRHIPVSGQCPVCHMGAQNVCHLMFTCMRARDVWRALGLKEVIDQALDSDRFGSIIFENLLRDQRRQSPKVEHLGFQKSIIVGAWYIWWQRREVIME